MSIYKSEQPRIAIHPGGILEILEFSVPDQNLSTTRVRRIQPNKITVSFKVEPDRSGCASFNDTYSEGEGEFRRYHIMLREHNVPGVTA